MSDTLARENDVTGIIPARTMPARLAGTYGAWFDHFETRAVTELELTFEGIAGDYHSGVTRASGAREPWYARGTEMRNERQITIVATDELAMIAESMGIAEVKPEWIGANLLIDGVPHLSMLPPGTLMFFAGGATLKVDTQNGPCRIAGRAVAENAGMEDHKAASLAFPKAAKRLRGLVAWVEKPGTIVPGEEISARVPEHWLYRG